METGAVAPGGQSAVTAGVRVRDVVSDVVAEVAPQELPLVAELARLDDAEVVRQLRGRRRRRKALGFGLDEVAALATPVAWLALDQVAQRIAGYAVDGAARGIRAALRRVFRRHATPATIPPLTREQLGQVRRLVAEMAVQRGLGEKRASVIADAVVARLALAPSGNPGQKPTAPGRAAGGGT
jgi:hypothetical protein